ncbi:MAG TPA: hypothetical protein VIM04_09925 [Candidatus Binatia bacterium]|jgi:hypothetical protein
MLIEFTARDDPKGRDIDVEKVLDDGIIREMAIRGLIERLR